MKSIEKLKNRVKDQAEKNPPAKNAPVLTGEEQTDIERFIELMNETAVASRGEGREIKTFHPSSLGIYAGKCQRRFVYLFRGEKPESNIDGKTIRIFDNGSAVHERLQKVFESMEIGMQTEVRLLHDDPPISGYIDGIITLPWNNRKIVLEIKSINENGFISRKKWKKAKDEHVAQANLYCYLTDIDTMWIIYENKNTQDIDIYQHKLDRKKAEKLLKTWRETWQMFQDGKLPKRPFKMDSQACTYCDMRWKCIGDEEIGS
jgi:CRISPR/Cas system-associated exonuclease Cas4 (RecB family)